MDTHYRLFYGKEHGRFHDWQSISLAEVESLIAFYEAYQSKI